MGGKTGKATIAAKKPETKSAPVQPFSAPKASENKTETAVAEHAPDNNKRLAALEAGVADLSLVLVNGGYCKEVTDPIAAAIWALSNTDATSGELAAIKRAEEAEANYLAASNQLAAIQTFILSHDDFETVEGEELPETVIRFVGGQEPGPIADGDPGREQLGRLEAGQVESFTALPAIAASFSLMFADGDAVLDVAPRSVSREEISRDGEHAVYDRRLIFSPAEPPHNITAVWLVAFDPRDSEGIGDVAAVRCDVPGGLRVGGGAMAAIPAGHLIF